MRLIDADEALSKIKPYEASDEKWGVTGGTAIRLIHKAIDNAPTIDAVSVVRCKNCKQLQCCNFTQFLGLDGYCSYGEYKRNLEGIK